MSTEADVLFWAPSLAGDTRIPTALTKAAARLSPTAYGDQYSEAVACLAGHMLLLTSASSDGLARGPVTSEKSGGESRSYGSISGAASLDEAALARTEPGLQLIAINNSLAEVGFGVLL